MTNTKKTAAFTLLELLLVISIIAVISILSISVFHKREIAQKIKQTTFTMQQILQAGVTFYNDNNQTWPSGDTGSLDPGAKFSSYLPRTYKYNPWNQNTYYFQPTTKGFQVTTIVPNAILAKQVAAELPDAAIDTTQTNKIIAQITVQHYLSFNYKVVKAGIGENGGTINVPCSADKIKYITAPNNIRPAPLGYIPSYTGIRPWRYATHYPIGTMQTALQCSTSGSNQSICTIKATINCTITGLCWGPGHPHGSVDASYLIMCRQ